METTPQVVSPAVERNGAALQHAVDFMQTNANRATVSTQRVVRRYPLASVGVALGAGIAVGAAAHYLFAPKRSRWLGKLF